jgi:hypothetical protein
MQLISPTLTLVPIITMGTRVFVLRFLGKSQRLWQCGVCYGLGGVQLRMRVAKVTVT